VTIAGALVVLGIGLMGGIVKTAKGSRRWCTDY